jgi:hypothetical protein
MVVAKDYRLIGMSGTMASQESEFKADGHYDPTLMKFEYVLDVEQGSDEFPDTEVFLVKSGSESKPRLGLYSVICYRVSLFLFLDSFYALLLVCLTQPMADYVIVKCFSPKDTVFAEDLEVAL